jgi:riboflavin synthase
LPLAASQATAPYNAGMFTGLVQTLGSVRSVREDGSGGRTLTIGHPPWPTPLVLGESVAVNGACLTVVESDAESATFQAGPETLAKTALASLAAGDRVNLERALRAGDAIGGHFVTGHVDAVGRLLERHTTGEWQTVWFAFPPELGDLLVNKGSVAVDGVSLTLMEVKDDRFSVMLIPHTLANTTLGETPDSGPVNLEADLLAKHVQKLLRNVTITI